MLPITALYAGLTGLAFAALSLRVSLGRMDHQVSWGDGGDKDMRRRIRQHGNFAEYAPITLILLGLTETMGAPASVLHGAGLVLLASRLMHYLGMKGGRLFILRRMGIVLCYLLIMALSAGLVGHALL